MMNFDTSLITNFPNLSSFKQQKGRLLALLKFSTLLCGTLPNVNLSDWTVLALPPLKADKSGYSP